MQKTSYLIAIGLVGLSALTSSARLVPNDKPTVVVGTYDSRGVLTAYVRSNAFREYMSAQQKDIRSALERAEAAGDAELAETLHSLGPAMQKRIHAQGFSTAPIDGIMAGLDERLPAIAAEAGVDLIVSRWELDYRSPSAKAVDITQLLVAEFEPDERTLQAIRDLLLQEPVPLADLSDDH